MFDITLNTNYCHIVCPTLKLIIKTQKLMITKEQLTRKLSIASLQHSDLKRTLKTPQLVALGIGAIIGTGIFVITGQAAANYAGPALTISFAISALGCVMAALCYAEFASMMPSAGSVYTYSYASMGEFMGWFIGWTLVLEYLFVCSSVAVGWSGYAVSLLADWGVNIPTTLSNAPITHTSEGWVSTGNIINFPAMFIVAVVATLLIGGQKESTRINNIIVVVKMAVILLFIGFGLSYIDTANWVPYIPENTGEYGQFGWSGIMRGAGIVFFAYLGFDAVSTVAGEVINPQKTMPKGILISLLICALLYIAVTAVLTGMVNYTELNVPAPIALAIDKAGDGLLWLRPLIKLGAIAGITSVILVLMMAQARIYYAISRDGLLPKVFSKLDKKQTPVNGTIVAASATGLVAGLLPLEVISELTSIGTLLAFSVVCIAILVLRKTQPNLERPFKTPWVPFVPIMGILICGAQMFSLSGDTWIRLITWTAVGFVIYFLYGIRHSNLNNTK